MSDPTPRRAANSALFVAGLLLGAPVLLPQPARADPPVSAGDGLATPTPPRIGNRWDNLDHQPTQADVGAAEQELGLARSAEHDRAVDNELQELGSQLLQVEQTDPAVNRR